MYPQERRKWLVEHARQNGRVSVTEASARLGVVPETIRRDLDQLAARALLRRVHGGAIPAGFDQLGDAPLDTRDASAVEQKELIALRAIDELPADGGTILLDAGSSVGRLAAHLPADSRFVVFTNSAPIAALTGARTSCEVRLVGGRLRGTTAATVGNTGEFGRLRVDVAFMGTNALSAEHGLSTPDVDEAATKTAMIGAAHTVVVLADSRKIGAESTVRFAMLDDIDVLVTDTGIPQGQLELIRNKDLKVVCA
ncbi:DeoR/GlpR family DNA-binding transcription regulator [uncultured Propionibacterium sp.]|uniref:DeoR/GlpR family DNA-binding transcription regulator n=1 Tax=uncultured Propionibacterium sp. TaxID=218066 RepID=UPI00292D2493|nr:DeoR/GlpR family DNA-binding transcription regulator [uncultured Propionibacterium sp.]